MNPPRKMPDDRGFQVNRFHRSSPDRVRHLIRHLDELALSEVAVFVFGVSVVLEHLQDDFVLAGRRVGVLVIGVRAGGDLSHHLAVAANLPHQLRPPIVAYIPRVSFRPATRISACGVPSIADP